MILSWPAGRLAVCGSASQEPPSTVSGPANAQGGTASGPYVVKPDTVLEPPSPTSFSPQYVSDTCRGRYRPVTANRTR